MEVSSPVLTGEPPIGVNPTRLDTFILLPTLVETFVEDLYARGTSGLMHRTRAIHGRDRIRVRFVS